MKRRTGWAAYAAGMLLASVCFIGSAPTYGGQPPPDIVFEAVTMQTPDNVASEATAFGRVRTAQLTWIERRATHNSCAWSVIAIGGGKRIVLPMAVTRAKTTSLKLAHHDGLVIARPPTTAGNNDWKIQVGGEKAGIIKPEIGCPAQST